MKLVDVDGSYLPQEYEQLKQAGVQVAPVSPPPMPPGGWETVTEENHRDIAKNIPVVLPGENWTFPFIFITLAFIPGVLYSYSAEGVGHSAGKGAFRALFHGYIHWASGQMERLEVNYLKPSLCDVRHTMKPSM